MFVNEHKSGIKDRSVLMGISLQAHPTDKQKLVLSQWMGCARFIWNSKCDEDSYLTRYARKHLPVGTYAPVDQRFAQYKDAELSPWLYDCPSQILRNSAVNWYQTYQNFLKGRCGKPRKKRKSDTDSVHLTRELFRFETGSDGVTRLFVGTKRNNIGFLSIKNHANYEKPSSIRIKRKNGKYLVSFCYEDGMNEDSLLSAEQHLEYLKGCNRTELEKCTVGIDRGVVRPLQAGNDVYDFSEEQKATKSAKERFIRRCQRRLAKQTKGSKRRKRTKRRIARAHEKVFNIRKDFCHKASRAVVDKEETKVIIFEDLKTAQMTKSPSPKKASSGMKWEKNGRAAKAGLNRSILDKCWHQLARFVTYKAYRAGKAVFWISAHYTSQECADCGHTHPNNRKSQGIFCCESCGHSDNADQNAAEVIKKRAINLILYSGTELSKRGVLLDTGRGAASKTRKANAICARSKETSKKNGKAIAA